MKNSTKWVVYGVLPLALSLVLQGMYFSGNLVLQRLICPKLPPLSPDSYREFGLVENVQNLLLLALLLIVVIGVVKSVDKWQRLAFCALTLLTGLVMLEEIDYGTHFYTYMTTSEVAGWFEPAGSPAFQALVAKTDFQAEPFNLHNRGDLTDIIKAIVSAVILGLFVIAPFFEQRITNPWLRYLVPDRFTVITVAVMLLMRFVTRYLSGLDAELILSGQENGQTSGREVGAMSNNLSEFREVLTYYLFLTYLGVIVFFRRAPAAVRT